MDTSYDRIQRIIIFALLISLMALVGIPSNTMNAKALTGFKKVSPVNGATGQPVSLKLKWNAAPSNPYKFDTYYKYCYYKKGGTCDFQGLVYATEYTISGLVTATTYYWQIQVIYCKNSSCSQKEKHDADNGVVWSFTTVGVNPPGTFAKLSPANNTANITSRTLSWASSSGATSYQYCLSPTYNDNNCGHLGGWKDVGNVTSYTVPNDAKFIWGNRYYWQIRASNSGGTRLANDGTWWTFTTANLIGITSLISPTGVINESTPTYRWNHINGVTWYYLWINDATGSIFKQWYDASAVCNAGTCVATPLMTLNSGNFSWWIQAWNDTGYGPWSNSMSFNTPVPTAPGAATLNSPTGDIGNNHTPAFTWNKVEGATWYYLWIDSSAGNVFKQWYNMAQANCNGTTCSVTPSGLSLNGGAYTWRVQTWNSVGSGPWSAGMNFSIFLPPLPGKTTLQSPTGGIDTKNPTYSWNEVSGATWYYLWVDGPSGNVIQKWYTSAQANCNGTTCSVTNITPSLSAGEYTWKVQTWNDAGYGPWSDSVNFRLALPGMATLISPVDNSGTNNPTYTWNEVSGSTWYYLWVDGPSGNVIKQWYTSAQANCNGTTCSVTPTATLGSGRHGWWIQTWNDAGYGPWSDGMYFSNP